MTPELQTTAVGQDIYVRPHLNLKGRSIYLFVDSVLFSLEVKSAWQGQGHFLRYLLYSLCLYGSVIFIFIGYNQTKNHVKLIFFKYCSCACLCPVRYTCAKCQSLTLERSSEATKASSFTV